VRTALHAGTTSSRTSGVSMLVLDSENPGLMAQAATACDSGSTNDSKCGRFCSKLQQQQQQQQQQQVACDA
jgi:hypothetical protein